MLNFTFNKMFTYTVIITEVDERTDLSVKR